MQIKKVVTFCLFLPVFFLAGDGVLVHFSEIEYELAENHEKVDAEEKEESKKSKHEDTKACSSIFQKLDHRLNYNLSYINDSKTPIPLYLDSPLIPPE